MNLRDNRRQRIQAAISGGSKLHDQLYMAYRRSQIPLSEVVERSGVSETTVLNAFRGRNVTVWNVAAIAQVIGLPSLELADNGSPSSADDPSDS